MKTSILKQLSAACLMSILVPCGAFATMYIDHFDSPTGGQALSLTGTGTASSYVAGSGISTLSGTRYLEITKTAPTSGGTHSVDINTTAFPSVLADSLQSGADGSSRLIWDGNGNGIIDYSMAAVDLTEGGLNSVIDIRIISNDKPGVVTLNFGDGTTSKDYTFTLPDYTNPYPMNFLVPFTFWTGVDFSQIRGAGMSILLQTSEDLRIDYIGTSAPVPEPSTFLLLGAGLVGAGLIRRRAKKGASLVSVSGTAPSV